MKDFSQIKVIFFDIGDTLYTNEQLEKAYPQKLYELLSLSKGISIDQAKLLLHETTEKLKLTEKHVTKVRAMAELGYSRAQCHDVFSTVNPYQFLAKDQKLDEVITSLAKNYKLGVISNFKRSHVVQILEALGLQENFFTFMVTEDIVEKLKPALEPFQKAVELSGVTAQACLYVGDSPSKDMRPAKEVGMTTILMKTHPKQDDLHYADEHIDSIVQLPSLL
ncbi:MAG: HAD family hydrolase [Patescibacteria group bacterium]|nr:HAD family hydrolase [Patescibacteria group bacterium]